MNDSSYGEVSSAKNFRLQSRRFESSASFPITFQTLTQIRNQSFQSIECPCQVRCLIRSRSCGFCFNARIRFSVNLSISDTIVAIWARSSSHHDIAVRFLGEIVPAEASKSSSCTRKPLMNGIMAL